MKTYQTIRKNLALIGIMPNQIHYHHYPFSRQSLIANLICIVGFISTTVFTFGVAKNTKEYMDSLYVLVMACSIFVSYTTNIINMNKWFDFFEHYDKFVDDISDLEHDDNRPQMDAVKLNETNKLVELLSKVIYFVIVIVGVPVFILPKAIVSFYNYFARGLDGIDAFELSLPVWMPFNWKNPVGYLWVIIYQSISASFLLHYIACFISLSFGGFIFLTFSNTYMIDVLKSINNVVTKQSKNTKTKSANDRRKSKTDSIFTELSTFINIHAEIKQISSKLSQLCETTLTVLFLGCTIALSLTLLLIEISHFDYLMLWKSSFYGVGVFGLVFFSCELGQRFTNSFDDIDEFMIGDLNWYLLPIEIQRLFPLTVMNVQQPVVVKCFGNVLCSREQFKKVCNASYQYFMVLRKFYD